MHKYSSAKDYQFAAIVEGSDDAITGKSLDGSITSRNGGAEEALRASEQQYCSLSAHMLDGFAYCQMLFDEQGHPDDFVYLDVNDAFERLTGLKDVIGKRVTQVIPQIKELNPELLEIYGRVASTGNAEKFEIDFKALGLHLSVAVYSPAKGFFVAGFDDITARKQAEAALRDSEKRLAADLDAMTRLQHLGSRFVHEGNLQPVLGEIVDAAIAIADADFGDIQLLDPVTNDLRIVAQRGFPQWWLDYWETVAKGQGCCGTAFWRGERVIVADVERSPIYAGTPALGIQLRAGVRAVQSTPLLSRGGKPLGMFSTHYKAPYQPGERALRLLDLLARQAADIIERAQNEEQLRQLAAFNESALKSLGEAVYTIDGQGLVTFMNPAAEELFGWTFAELRGKNMHAMTHHHYRDGRPFPACECAGFQVLTHGRPLKNYEDVFIRKDGTYFDVIYTITPLFDDSGKMTGLILVFSDVTERKKREEQVQLLLREVNHRAKNMLTLVQAIAWHTAADTPEDFVTRFSERVSALGASQDLLVQSEWRGVELEPLVRRQLAHFEDLVGTRITLDGLPLRLCAAASQSVGMALHELSTNASKYGALSNADGRVSISWRIEPANGSCGSFVFSWAESGGPMVVPPTRRGFGHRVLVTMPKLQLDADVQLGYAPSGVSWRIACAAAKVLEPPR